MNKAVQAAKRLRIAFMGSPDFSVPALRALHLAGHEIVAVYSQPPKPKNRGQVLSPCPVHQAALELGLKVRTPAKLKRDEEEHGFFAGLALDAAVVAAYGLILPKPMLTAPRLGCLNIHASLLPRWRGAAPVQAAILAGDEKTGITIMQMEEGLDTGPMLLTQEVSITNATTTPMLLDSLSALGAEMILRVLAEHPAPLAQPEAGVTYAAKLTREDGRVDWHLPAAVLDRKIRALNPWPGVFCKIGDEVLKILAAEVCAGSAQAGAVINRDFTVACGEGALRLKKVQRAGRPAMAADAFLRGMPALAFLT